MFLYTKAAHPISSLLENPEASFAHGIIYSILHPAVSYNCYSPLFSVIYELSEGRGNF